MIVKIKRQDDVNTSPYWQSFEYSPCGKKTVSGILDEINYLDDLFDVEGKPCRRIRWECSCMQKVCGACAMIINKKPALACCEFIDTDKTKTLVLEPLSKFPVVCDLIVDRTCIFEHQKQALLYLGERAEYDEKQFEQQYNVAKCLKCGLCLEVCPNYSGNNDFYGALFVNEAYLLYSTSKDRKKQLKTSYRKHFENSCSKSLSCRNICPVKMQTLSSIAYLNRK